MNQRPAQTIGMGHLRKWWRTVKVLIKIRRKWHWLNCKNMCKFWRNQMNRGNRSFWIWKRIIRGRLRNWRNRFQIWNHVWVKKIRKLKCMKWNSDNSYRKIWNFCLLILFKKLNRFFKMMKKIKIRGKWPILIESWGYKIKKPSSFRAWALNIWPMSSACTRSSRSSKDISPWSKIMENGIRYQIQLKSAICWWLHQVTVIRRHLISSISRICKLWTCQVGAKASSPNSKELELWMTRSCRKSLAPATAR